MATVEVELRNYKRKNGQQPLVLRVTAGSAISRRNTGLYILEKEWDSAKRRVNRKHPQFAVLNDALDRLCKDAEGAKAEAIKERVPVRPSAVINDVFGTRDFYVAAEAKKKTFTDRGKYNSEKNYTSMISLLRNYSPTLSIEDITPKFLEGYRAHLQKLEKAPNTITYHLGKIKAVLNTVDLKGESPFKKFKVGTYTRSLEQILTMEDINKIRNYIPKGKWQQAAKDTFLFSFYAAGMSSSDVLQLKWSQINKGRIKFGRNKVKDSTGIQLNLPINKVLQSILDRQNQEGETVFGLATMFGQERAACREREKIQALINRALKAISLNAGVGKSITFKMARTAFAQIANEVSCRNVYGIQQAMGHTKIATTEIYLGSDSRAVDELLQVVYATS